MREEIIKLYTFDELPDDVKRIAIDKNRDFNVNYEWYNFAFENFRDKLQKIGVYVEIKDFSFSGFWSQGDGASFTGTIDLPVLLENLQYSETPDLKTINRFKKYGIFDYLDTKIERISHHYAHSGTVSTFVRDSFTREVNNISAVVAEYEEIVRYEIECLCDELYKILEEEYEYLTSDEAISESLIANECDFTIDGNIYQ